MKNMDMNVLMEKIVPASSAVLRIAELVLGDMEGYTYVLQKLTLIPEFSSQLLSACSIWSIGYPIYTFKNKQRNLPWKHTWQCRPYKS